MRQRLELLTKVRWRDQDAEVVAHSYTPEPKYDLLIDGHQVVIYVDATEIEPVAI